MKINWKVRVKNPVFWVEVVLAVVLPILAYMGMSWQDMTSWAALGEVFVSAVQNPVIVVAVAVSVWNAVIDPTTSGLSDSARALGYEDPSDGKNY